MITPSFALTATERVLPKLALDFTTASLDSRVTFTRSGAVATRVNASGYIETVTANTPRFDFNPVTLVCAGLLIEEARTNLFTYSEDATNWNGVTGGTLSNSFTSPANTSTANLITEDTSTGEHYVRKNITGLTANTNYSISYFVKTNGRNFRVRALDTDIPANGYYATFNSTTGAVINSASVGIGVFASTKVVAYGNGWYRVTVTGNGGVTCTKYTVDLMLTLPGGGSTSFTGTGTLGLYFWGAEVEAGAFPTSYIPTVASQVTRTADIATMTGTNFSSWFNASAGTFRATYEASPNTFTSYFVASNGVAAQNSIHFDNDSGNMRVVYYSGSSAVATLGLGAIGTVGTVNSAASSYVVNNFVAARNAGAVVTDTAGAVPVSLTQMNIGADPSGAAVNVMNARIQKIFYYPLSLTSAEVQAFSKS
jgi:hypothetical protein